MSYCTKHPGKEAVGACCECGHLVCKACYTELNEKVYCASCANMLFTLREQEAAKTVIPPSVPQPQKPKAETSRPVEPAKQIVQAEQTKTEAVNIPTEPTVIENPVTPPIPQIIKQAKPAVVKDIQPLVREEKRSTQPASGNIGFLWWLAPIFLAFIGGLLAWFMNKNSEPGKAKTWLFTGIGLTVVYAGIITGIFLTSGASSTQGSIIFARNTDKNWQLWTIDPDGKNVGKLTACDNNSMYFNVYPSLSPATQKLTGYTNRDGNFEVYIMDARSNGQTNLTNHNFTDLFADISPDGHKIAFVSNRDGNWEIYTMQTDGSDVKQLTVSKPVDDRPHWSPDGKLIAFNSDRDGNHEIYVMNADGSNQRRITTSDKWDGMARWSPDGKKITFVSERDGNPEIYIMDSDGNNPKRITFNSAKDYAPCFSPDGSKIVFYSNTDGSDKIYIMNTDGGNQIRLTDNQNGDQYPVWTNIKITAPAKPTAPAVRSRVIGSNISTANKWYNFSDNITFVKYIAERDGSVDTMKVYSAVGGNVKAAIYDHNAKNDMPMSKLSSNNEPTPCQANQWNNIPVAPVTLTKGTTYWLAFNSDVNGVVRQGTGQARMLKGGAEFEGFSFPDKPPAGMTTSKYDFSISCWGFGEGPSSGETETSPDKD